MVRISRSLLNRIIALAAAEETEICGLLLGRGDECAAIMPTANVAEKPAAFFEIDPSALIAAHRAARTGGPAVLGHYHSHPSGVAEPSAADAAAARPDGALWLIVAGRDCLLWRAGEEGLHGRFMPQSIELT
jgi:proteasome lid subunit RPN8/RPN11